MENPLFDITKKNFLEGPLLDVIEPPRLTKWDKLLGRKDPIFETRQWKEYLKQRGS